MKRLFNIVLSLAFGICLMQLTACDGGTVANAASETSKREELIQSDMPDTDVIEAEASEQEDPSHPYANLTVDQIESIAFAWSEYDSWKLPEERYEEVVAALVQLEIDLEPIKEFDVDESKYLGGDLGWRADMFAVSLKDGSSFTVSPWEEWEGYGFLTCIDNKMYTTERDTVSDLMALYREYVEVVREQNGLPDVSEGNQMNQDMERIREEYKDDPKGYEEALGEYLLNAMREGAKNNG